MLSIVVLRQILWIWSKQTSQTQKKPTEVLYIKSCFEKFLQYSQITPVLESPFDKVAAQKVGYFIKKRLQQRCFPVKVRDRFWTWFLSEFYVSTKISEWGCGSSKTFMTISVLEIKAFIPKRIVSQFGSFFAYKKNLCGMVWKSIISKASNCRF